MMMINYDDDDDDDHYDEDNSDRGWDDDDWRLWCCNGDNYRLLKLVDVFVLVVMTELTIIIGRQDYLLLY